MNAAMMSDELKAILCHSSFIIAAFIVFPSCVILSRSFPVLYLGKLSAAGPLGWRSAAQNLTAAFARSA
jgi:hypothetical protein